MNRDMMGVLPLGSVVLLKDAKRYLVVMGYLIIEEGTNKVWDYMGCAYPIGAISSDAILTFDANQIEKVIANNLINTIINIQKTGYANILSVTSVDNAITQESTLLEDLKYKKIDVLNKLNSDLARKRRI